MLESSSRQSAGSELAYVVCRPDGELDAASVTAFRDALAAAAEHPVVIVDLSDVPFLDSSALGALIGGIRRVRDRDGKVAVVCSRPTVLRVLQTTGFDRMVPVAESVGSALAALDDEAA